MLLTTIFYHVDNFCNEIRKTHGYRKETNKGGTPSKHESSEILTIYIFFHHSKFKTFKDYYKIYIQVYYKSAFRKTVSYNRFVELIRGKYGLPLLYSHCL